MARSVAPNNGVRLLACFIIPLPMGARLASANHLADVCTVRRAEPFDTKRGGILRVLIVELA